MTLVEVLLAVAILAIVGVALLMALGGGLMGAIVAGERTIAESLARSQIEAIKNAQYDATPPYQYDKITNIPASYSINPNSDSIQAFPIDPGTGVESDSDTGLQKVIITIFRGEKQILQVKSYKGMR